MSQITIPKHYLSFLSFLEKVNLKKEKIANNTLFKIVSNQIVIDFNSSDRLEKIENEYIEAILMKSERNNSSKNKRKKWAIEELKVLVWILVTYAIVTDKTSIDDLNEEDWVYISTLFDGLSPEKLKLKWFSLQKSIQQKRDWCEEEDNILKEIINMKKKFQMRSFLSYKWNEIAEELNKKVNGKFSFRLGKHCRERWLNHLNPILKKGEWNLKEDVELLQFIKSFGKKWSFISRRIASRNENSVKNRFFALKRKFMKEKNPNLKINENNLISSMISHFQEIGVESLNEKKSLLKKKEFDQEIIKPERREKKKFKTYKSNTSKKKQTKQKSKSLDLKNFANDSDEENEDDRKQAQNITRLSPNKYRKLNSLKNLPNLKINTKIKKKINGGPGAFTANPIINKKNVKDSKSKNFPNEISLKKKFDIEFNLIEKNEINSQIRNKEEEKQENNQNFNIPIQNIYNLNNSINNLYPNYFQNQTPNNDLNLVPQYSQEEISPNNPNYLSPIRFPLNSNFNQYRLNIPFDIINEEENSVDYQYMENINEGIEQMLSSMSIADQYIYEGQKILDEINLKSNSSHSKINSNSDNSRSRSIRNNTYNSASSSNQSIRNPTTILVPKITKNENYCFSADLPKDSFHSDRMHGESTPSFVNKNNNYNSGFVKLINLQNDNEKDKKKVDYKSSIFKQMK